MRPAHTTTKNIPTESAWPPAVERRSTSPAKAKRRSSFVSIEWPSLKLEYLKPIIPGVHSDNSAALIHGHAPWVGQLPGIAAGGAPDLQTFAGLLIHQLHTIVAEFADDEV